MLFMFENSESVILRVNLSSEEAGFRSRAGGRSNPSLATPMRVTPPAEGGRLPWGVRMPGSCFQLPANKGRASGKSVFLAEL